MQGMDTLVSERGWGGVEEAPREGDRDFRREEPQPRGSQPFCPATGRYIS